MKSKKQFLAILLSLCFISISAVNAAGEAGEMARAARAFRLARAVWPVGQQREMNVSVGFRAVFDAPADGRAVLRLTGATIYRVFLNGNSNCR